MDERKQQVLHAIIKDYISTGEPVGSRAVAKRSGLGVSPATIRNEMSDLEELGYIEQPHTSAGRRPSDKGYRYYVDYLMPKEKLASEEVERIHRAFSRRKNEVDDFMQQCCHLIARMTNYATMIVLPQGGSGKLEDIHLFQLNTHQLLVVLLSDTGLLNHRVMDLDTPLPEQKLAEVNYMLQKRMRGISLDHISSSMIKELMGDVAQQQKVLPDTLELLEQLLGHESEEKVFTAGAMNMIMQPEFHDLNKLKNIFELLEEKGKVKSLLTLPEEEGINISIGAEMPEENVKYCSMILASYQIKGEKPGVIGVLGPTRMSYPKTVALLECIAEELSEALFRKS